MARFRPRCPIIVVTRDARVARQMHLYRGCFPLIYDRPPKENVLEEHDERLEFALDMGKRMGFMKVENAFVFVSGCSSYQHNPHPYCHGREDSYRQESVRVRRYKRKDAKLDRALGVKFASMRTLRSF